ncbi:MAG: molybdenum cofactor guanylyltransferase [Saprospiraceae bacterium]|nr:molybdenum cofactor guanylyltransferase [Saprospiraceae bacterium]
MGRDKGLIPWHGLPQREYLVDLLQSLGIQAFISCRPEQVASITPLRAIPDKYPDSGPLGAIASAFAEDSFAAWLVIACDMPLVDHAVLQYLLNSRRPDFAATAFRSPSLPGDTPDPLLAIWEPAVLPVLKSSMKKGNKSVHRVLTTAGVFLLEPPDPAVLTNTNMPEEMAMIDPFLKEIFLLH